MCDTLFLLFLFWSAPQYLVYSWCNILLIFVIQGEILFVMSDILLYQFSINNTKQRKLFNWDRRKQFVIFRYFVISDLFIFKEFPLYYIVLTNYIWYIHCTCMICHYVSFRFVLWELELICCEKVIGYVWRLQVKTLTLFILLFIFGIMCNLSFCHYTAV